MQAPVASRPVTFQSAMLSFQTECARQFVDITEQVQEHLAASGIRMGLAIVSSLHTTAAIIVNEHEPELLKDLDGLLERLAPEQRRYAHNMVPCGPNEIPNGHAHCQALLLASSASLPVVEGRFQLGRYQRIFLVELDHARSRTVRVTFLGA